MRRAAVSGVPVYRRKEVGAKEIGLIEWVRLVCEIRVSEGLDEDAAVARAKVFLRTTNRDLFHRDHVVARADHGH